MKKFFSIVLAFFAMPGLSARLPQPKLIVQIVVDQLRGDLLTLHQQKFSKDGFNYLMHHGIHYANTHHPHANTVTCAGHATIATGGYPALHGIISNKWYSSSEHRSIYCMADKNSPILKIKAEHKKLGGRSPANLMASTISDEIILSRKGRSYAVSFKDRGAITLAGHAGKAFWFDKVNGGFVSSRWYYEHYPQWLNDWNKNYHPKPITWTLSQPTSSYRFADAPRFKHRYQGFGQSFPHHTGPISSPTYFKFLSMTPVVDKLTGEFAEKILIEEKLGQQENKSDYLGISFSAVDAIGHQFGPNSLESEDNLLQLDKTLAHFLKTVDEHVGLENTLILLSADHGVSDTPAYLKAHGIKEIQPIKIDDLTQTINTLLKQRFQLPDNSIENITPPYVYLNRQIIYQHHLNLAEVQNYLSENLSQYPGIYKAYTLPLNLKNKGWVGVKVNRMNYPDRSGDLYLVAPPYQSYGNKSEARVAHGSPWQYDSFVPLLIVNPQFKANIIDKPIYTTDIAPTLSAILMIKSPSAAVGRPLKEVVDYYR